MQHIKTIPVSIAQYVLRNNLVREFALLIKLKEQTSGRLHERDLIGVFRSSGVVCRSTFDKQFKRLQDHGFVYRHTESQYYKLTSFKRFAISKKLNNPLRAFRYEPQNTIPRLRAYLFASIVANEVRKVKYFYTRVKQNNRGVSSGSDTRLPQKQFGVAMERIKALIGYGQTYMSRMKILANKFKFLTSTANWFRVGQFEYHRGIDFFTSPINFTQLSTKKKCVIKGVVTGGSYLNTYLKNKGR